MTNPMLMYLSCIFCHCEQENKFDEMIGVLQDLLIDPEFVNMQSDFCLKNCGTLC